MLPHLRILHATDIWTDVVVFVGGCRERVPYCMFHPTHLPSKLEVILSSQVAEEFAAPLAVEP